MFNSNFLWGSASAAYQIEGGQFADGKLPSIWDEYAKVPGNTYMDTTGEVAIDFYNRFEEDIALMKEQGLKAYRFSIAWTRIINEDRSVNKKGVAFYDQIIDGLIAAKIEPIVTIYHWDLPQFLQDEYGGWENRKIVEDFNQYSTILFKYYGHKVNYWVTLNEQNIFTELGYLKMLHPPNRCNYQTFIDVNHHAFLANAQAIKTYRAMELTGKIGPSFAFSPVYSASVAPTDVIAAENAQELLNWYWLDVYLMGHYSKASLNLINKLGAIVSMTQEDRELLTNVGDFIGVNYYQTTVVQAPSSNFVEKDINFNTVYKPQINVYEALFKEAKNITLEHTDWGWAIDPTGLEITLRRLTSRYNTEILITENGLGAIDILESDNKIHDQYRIDYLALHIEAIKNAIADGSSVIGYCTWSFQDLFSWLNGYKKRYGFIYVDRTENDVKELKRYKKDSFYWFQNIIETNGGN